MIHSFDFAQEFCSCFGRGKERQVKIAESENCSVVACLQNAKNRRSELFSFVCFDFEFPSDPSVDFSRVCAVT